MTIELTILCYLAAYVVLSFVCLSVLYASYVLLMDYLKSKGIKKKQDIKGFKDKSIVYAFIIFDVFCNLFIVTVFSGFDVPSQLTVTARLKKWRRKYEPLNFNHLNSIQQNRLLLAIWACETKLDRDDVLNAGDHC